MSGLLYTRSVCDEIGLKLTEVMERQFIELRHALYEANTQANFTRVPIADCDERHFAESLMIADLIFTDAHVLDIGTGPGFPVLPLAIVRPDCRFTALDSNTKMLEFLKSFALSNVDVVQGRIEELGWNEKFDLVTGRALAPLTQQLEISVRPCRIGGRVVPFRSIHDDVETRAANQLGLRLTGVLRRNTSDESAIRVFPIYEKVRSTPDEFPRQWARMKKAPL